jgi:hypothetical protein
MRTRSPKSILAISGVLALTAAVALPTASMARGFGPGAGDCDGDCTADGAQVLQVRARDGSGFGAATQARGNNVAARNNNGATRNNGTAAKANVNAARGNGSGVSADDTTVGVGLGRGGNGLGVNGAGNGPNDDGERGPGTCDECTAEMGTLTEAQVDDLVYMANEEKMAHDVYVAMADLHGARMFANIAESEARHFEAVNTVLERYGYETQALEDPFTNDVITELYDELMAQGSESLDEAIAAGLLIEQTDLADLESRMAELETSAPDAFEMYTHLLAGTQNHLATFERWS